MESLFGIIDRNMGYVFIFKMQKVQMAYASLRFAFQVAVVVRHIAANYKRVAELRFKPLRQYFM
jgi:hypothetical protein